MSYDRIKMIRTFDDDIEPDLPRRIASEIKCADQIQQTIEVATGHLEKAAKVYEAVKQEYKKVLREAQDLCAHSVYTDCLGFDNSFDQCDQCDVCGKQLDKSHR